MMISLHVDYPPCFVLSKFDFTSLILWEKNGVEQIVWPRPPHGNPVTLREAQVSSVSGAVMGFHEIISMSTP